ncbi:DUF7507 domain-containing protein [Sphingobacterium hungaricum]
MMKLICRVMIVFSFFITNSLAYADGSKDFYPQGVQGNRAFLVSHNGSRINNASMPFLTLGTHYVYVQAGEKLAVASSAQGVGQGKIILTSPTNQIINTSSSNLGRIADNGSGTRAAELAGPRRGYAPYEVLIDASNQGIWKIEFVAPSGDNDHNVGQNKAQNVRADKDWVQTNEYFISAWDISVRNRADEDWIKGRVYTNTLNLQISGDQIEDPNQAFYGKNYVLTNDGYVYQVNGNGSNGIAFCYFVNNKGFLDEKSDPLYKSVNNSSIDSYKIQDPRTVDSESQITHKIMYTRPDIYMPEIGYGAVPGGQTWLYKKQIDLKVTNIQINGIEGTSNYVSKRGSYISFETNAPASYKIYITSSDSRFNFQPVEIIFNAKAGENSVFWDGKDGNGKSMPVGDSYPITVKIQKLGGEVHFPYLDMEINPEGLIIELLDEDYKVKSDIVYWNDIDLTLGLEEERSKPITNLKGESSNENGHKWGTYSKNATGKGSDSFGNEKAMDTWTYIYDAYVEETLYISSKVADLAVEFTNVQDKRVELDELVYYEIKVVNKGPSSVKDAEFEFIVPKGFSVESIEYVTNCGVVHDPTAYKTLMDLGAKCEVIVKIYVKATEVPDDVYGVVDAEATILRPADVTDPDATSVLEYNGKPRTAHGECLNNGLPVTCNNIAYHSDYFLLEPLGERGQLILIKDAAHIDANRDQFAQVGEVIRYTFTIVNSGLVNVTELKLTDPLLSNQPLKLPSSSMTASQRVVITVDYVITQADLDRGSVTNTALITGKNPRGFDVSDRSGTTSSNDTPTVIVLPKKPQIALKKTVTNKGTSKDGLFTLGDPIIYLFEIRHSGDYPIDNLKFSDPKLSDTYIALPKTSIQNEVIRFQLTYVVTDADIEAGFVSNTATITGDDGLFGTKQTDISGLTYDDNKPTVVYTPTKIKALDDVATVYENESVVISILDNDQKGSSEIMKNKIRIVKTPANSTAVPNADGTILFTPNPEYFGEDVFTYQVADQNNLWSNEATVTVTILEAIPKAVDDYAETWYNRSVEFNVLENDKSTGVNIDFNSVEVMSYPQLGSIINLGNGNFRYEPNQFTTGVDNFTYTVKDINGGVSNVAKVTIVTKGFFIPNTFTPNGDGVNDTFKILGAHIFDKIELEVINRHGASIYRNANYKDEWDGNGMADGTYYFIINGYSNGAKSYSHKGTVTVIRSINY